MKHEHKKQEPLDPSSLDTPLLKWNEKKKHSREFLRNGLNSSCNLEPVLILFSYWSHAAPTLRCYVGTRGCQCQELVKAATTVMGTTADPPHPLSLLIWLLYLVHSVETTRRNIALWGNGEDGLRERKSVTAVTGKQVHAGMGKCWRHLIHRPLKI